MLFVDIPYAWVNLRHGMGPEELAIQETNTAAVGSLTLEMGLLSRLTGTKAHVLCLDVIVSTRRHDSDAVDTCNHMCQELGSKL